MIYRHPINSGFEVPVRFSYRAPGWFPAYSIALHLGALLCSIVAEIPIFVRIFLIILILYSLINWVVDWYFTKVSQRRLEIILNVQGVWILRDNGLHPVTAKLVSARILHESLVYIKLKSTAGKHYQLWLSRGNADEDVLRRLRVRLLHPVASS